MTAPDLTALTVAADGALVLGAFRLTRTGLEVTGTPTFDEWQACGQSLFGLSNASLWAIGDWIVYGEGRGDWGETYTQAIDATQKSYDTMRHAAWIAEIFQFGRRQPNLSWSHHKEVAGLPEPEQDHWLDVAAREGLSRAELRERVRDARFAALGAPEPIAGRYHTLVIDPPWPMEKIERDVRPNQYGFDDPTLSEVELAALTLPTMADAHLFLWTTQKFLPMALRLLDAWAVRYVCTFVWHKPGGFQPVGLPQYNCEFVLYARRGSPQFLDTTALPTCFAAPRREHSRKPDAFYDVVRRVTAGPRVDMFSREPRDGFAQWGNETGWFIA